MLLLVEPRRLAPVVSRVGVGQSLHNKIASVLGDRFQPLFTQVRCLSARESEPAAKLGSAQSSEKLIHITHRKITPQARMPSRGGPNHGHANNTLLDPIDTYDCVYLVVIQGANLAATAIEARSRQS